MRTTFILNKKSFRPLICQYSDLIQLTLIKAYFPIQNHGKSGFILICLKKIQFSEKLLYMKTVYRKITIEKNSARQKRAVIFF